MSALAWLAIPVVAFVLAVAWAAWASRERPRADTHDTVLAHERFKAAFERAKIPPRRGPDGQPAATYDAATSGEPVPDHSHDVLS